VVCLAQQLLGLLLVHAPHLRLLQDHLRGPGQAGGAALHSRPAAMADDTAGCRQAAPGKRQAAGLIQDASALPARPRRRAASWQQPAGWRRRRWHPGPPLLQQRRCRPGSCWWSRHLPWACLGCLGLAPGRGAGLSLHAAAERLRVGARRGHARRLQAATAV
jgi:hypothetical protein